MRVSEIRVKRIRDNQGLGVDALKLRSFNNFLNSFCIANEMR